MVNSRGGVGGVGSGDPTKNVLDLVMAAIQRQDDLREAEAKYQNSMREVLADKESALRHADTLRRDDLAHQSDKFEIRIEELRSKNLETTSALLATALKETKSDLSERTAKLEQFRWESGGSSGGRSTTVAWFFAAFAAAASLASVIGMIVTVLKYHGP